VENFLFLKLFFADKLFFVILFFINSHNKKRFLFFKAFFKIMFIQILFFALICSRD